MKGSAKVVHYSEVAGKEFGPTAPGASIRWLIDEEHDGAPVFMLRMIELEPDGHSPMHTHPYEHENFVVEGRGEIYLDGIWQQLKVGDVVFVPPGLLHQYRNRGDIIFRFLCAIPVTKFQNQE